MFYWAKNYLNSSHFCNFMDTTRYGRLYICKNIYTVFNHCFPSLACMGPSARDYSYICSQDWPCIDIGKRRDAAMKTWFKGNVFVRICSFEDSSILFYHKFSNEMVNTETKINWNKIDSSLESKKNINNPHVIKNRFQVFQFSIIPTNFILLTSR